MRGFDILLQLVGAFYVFAGFVLARSTLTSRLLEQAIAAIGATPPRSKDRVQEIFSLVLSVVTFASGLALLALAQVAVYLFQVGAVLQGAFLFWISPRYIDDPGDGASPGRRQSINAFLIYAVITLVVAWAARMGRLRASPEMSNEALVAALALFAAFVGYLAWTYARTTLRRPKGSGRSHDEASAPTQEGRNQHGED